MESRHYTLTLGLESRLCCPAGQSLHPYVLIKLIVRAIGV